MAGALPLPRPAPDLLKEQVKNEFFHSERIRALAGLVLYVLAEVVGYLVTPLVGLATFLVLPAFYAVTSAGLYQLQVTRRITHRPSPPAS